MTITPPKSKFQRPTRWFSTRKKLMKLAIRPTAVMIVLFRSGADDPASMRK
jgi:hypothetical protein